MARTLRNFMCGLGIFSSFFFLMSLNSHANGDSDAKQLIDELKRSLDRIKASEMLLTVIKSNGDQISSQSVEPLTANPYCSYANADTILTPNRLLSNSVLATLYCQRKIPTEPKQAFQPEYDVPADLIGLWSEEYLSNHYASLGRISPDLAGLMDFQTFIDLNREAASVWSALLDCAGQDPEVAREFYLKGKFTCIDSSPSREMKEKIASLHAKTVAYLRTSKIETILNGDQYRALVEMHPLFTQVLDEIVATWITLDAKKYFVDRWIRKVANNPRVLLNLMHLVAILPQLRSSPGGLWPNAARSAHTYFSEKFKTMPPEVMELPFQMTRFSTILIAPWPLKGDPGMGFYITKMLFYPLFAGAGGLMIFADVFMHVCPLYWNTVLKSDIESARANLSNVSPLDSNEDPRSILVQSGDVLLALPQFYVRHSKEIVKSLRDLGDRYGISPKQIFE